ncbi:hypothetical protein D3C86_1916120 [compost metagenome]
MALPALVAVPALLAVVALSALLACTTVEFADVAPDADPSLAKGAPVRPPVASFAWE